MQPTIPKNIYVKIAPSALTKYLFANLYCAIEHFLVGVSVSVYYIIHSRSLRFRGIHTLDVEEAFRHNHT